MIACGLDFGTSNSAIGVMRNGVAELAPIEARDTLMPSAVFFDYETKGRVLLGNAAITAYVEQTEGRLMRALKSILGSPLIDEETSLCFDGYWLTEGLQNVGLTYTAGYTVIPADVEQAVIKMVCLQFSDRNRIGQNSRAIAGETVNYADAPVLSYWRSVVDAYRTPRIG